MPDTPVLLEGSYFQGGPSLLNIRRGAASMARMRGAGAEIVDAYSSSCAQAIAMSCAEIATNTKAAKIRADSGSTKEAPEGLLEVASSKWFKDLGRWMMSNFQSLERCLRWTKVALRRVAQ